MDTKEAFLFDNVLLLPLLIGLLTYLYLFYLTPQIGSNEAVYFVRALKLSNPNLFHSDWTLNNGGVDYGIVFTLFLKPFFSIFDNLIDIAHAARVTLWAIVLFCFTYFARTLKFSYFSILLSLSVFLFIGQGRVAQEWLIGGAEQKVLSYAFLFISLSHLAKKNYLLCGLFSGIAFFTHVLVGGWSAIAIGLILLFRLKDDKSALLKFSLLALPIALCFIFYVIFKSSSINMMSNDIMKIDVFKYLVKFRNPHHLNPFYFLYFANLIACAIYAVSVFYLKFKSNLSSQRQVIINFLIITGLFFCLGILARFFEFYFFLSLYPFRVADLLLPLFLCLFLVEKLAVVINQYQSHTSFKKSLLAIKVFLSMLPILFVFHNWSHYGLKNYQVSNFDKMTQWIEKNSELNEIFLVNPCKAEFWLKSQRAMLVNFKLTPTDNRFSGWYQRIVDSNGGKSFTGVGFRLCEEIKFNFESLTIQQLTMMQRKYNVRYYLLETERQDLVNSLIISKRNYYLYDLKALIPINEKLGI